MYAISNNVSSSLLKCLGLLVLPLAIAMAQDPETPQSDIKGTMSLTIVNATCVPNISLSVNGKMAYPEFPQGVQTGHAVWPERKAQYQAIDLKSERKATSKPIIFDSNSNQTLVILGDFSTDNPSDSLPQTELSTEASGKTYPPNVQFQVYPFEEKSNTPTFRFINAMPHVSLEISGLNLPQTVIMPGKDLPLISQPKSPKYTAKAGKTVNEIPLLNANQLIIFYLKDGIPTYKIVTETE